MTTLTHATTTTRPHRARRILTSLALGVVVVLLIAYLSISALAANILTTPRRVFSTVTPAAFDLAFSDVSFPTRSGDLRIAGWFIPQPSAHKAIVLVHGKDRSRTSEFGGHFVDFAAALHRRGFTVLMIDLRGHGRSGDAHSSFGLNERHDIEAAVDWLKSQGFTPGSIGVLGVSMGGAAGIGATADDSDIGALVEDSSYAAIAPIVQHEWRDGSGLPDLFLPSTVLISRLLFGSDLTAARPVDEIGRIAPRPVLIIHGTADLLIPLAHAEQLKAADSAADLWEVSGAGHARAYGTNPQAYVEKVASFFDRSLK